MCMWIACLVPRIVDANTVLYCAFAGGLLVILHPSRALTFFVFFAPAWYTTCLSLPSFTPDTCVHSPSMSIVGPQQQTWLSWYHSC